MLKEQAGELAGLLWNTLNGTEGMPLKQLKKLTNYSRFPQRCKTPEEFLLCKNAKQDGRELVSDLSAIESETS